MQAVRSEKYLECLLIEGSFQYTQAITVKEMEQYLNHPAFYLCDIRYSGRVSTTHPMWLRTTVRTAAKMSDI